MDRPSVEDKPNYLARYLVASLPVQYHSRYLLVYGRTWLAVRAIGLPGVEPGDQPGSTVLFAHLQ